MSANVAQAETMRALGKGGKDAFYKGPTGKAIAAAVAAEGGLVRFWRLDFGTYR